MKSRNGVRACLGQQGFTLLELMIGTAIAVIITAAAFTALTSSSKATRVNDQTAQTQQNGRLAMELLSHDIKMAGYGMIGAVGNCGTAIVPRDNTAAGVDTGPDSVSMIVPTTTSSLAAAAIGPFGTSANPLPLVSASGFSSGSIVSVGGVISASLATQTGNTFTLGSTIAAPVTFPAGTLVSLLQCVTYQVMQTGGANTAAICGANVPCLARGIAAPLLAGQIDCNGVGGATACSSIAEGIEDVQLAYACDGCNLAVNGGLADLVVDDQGPINNIFDATDFIPNSTITTTPPSSDAIRLVRVTVVAREAQNEQGFGEGTVAQANTAGPVIVEDHNPSTPGDPGYVAATYRQFRRRIITRTVEVRNIGL